MKPRLVVIGLAVAGIALVALLISYSQTVYALSYRDLEMVFVVTDAETGKPIPDASIDLMAEEYKERGADEQQVFRLITDKQGRARSVRENNKCEDIVRPFRRRVTLIDLTWASVNVSEGYSPVERMWLHTAKYENKGYFPEGRFQRVEFDVPLHRRPDG